MNGYCVKCGDQLPEASIFRFWITLPGDRQEKGYHLVGLCGRCVFESLATNLKGDS